MGPDTTRRYYEGSSDAYFLQTCERDLSSYWAMFEAHLKPGSAIIDLGCGSGRDLKRFAKGGHRPVGIDYSLPLLGLAARFSGQATVLGNIRLVPFRAEAFDAAWAMASLLHLPRSAIGRALRQIAACLKPGAPLFAGLKLGIGEETDSLGRFTTFYAADEWSDILAESNFSVYDLQIDIERRRLADGGFQEIPWIASLAIVRSGSMRRSHLPA
ncbi:class I SAM-dependent methyltransferase [Aquisphaera insulae]|uniref:class I SAM-dependent methyltransferase n=1 Tax=Aquisphaera insulae TaxID=2712864 RepID=UPI0013E9A4F9|nr:class I SAM-dependent methyltransferase [Aquisphaera insulae]